MGVNFRKFFCKSAKRGSWWYRLCDCKRYPQKPDKPTEPDKPAETVEVWICAQSGLLKSEWCVDTVQRTYPLGEQPTEFCQIHKAPPPPPKPRPPLKVRIKPSCYSLLTADGDPRRFLHRIREAVPEPGKGRLSTRVFYNQSWGTRLSRPLHPWKAVDSWTCPDYGRPARIYNLGEFISGAFVPSWDEEYWARFRGRHLEIREEIGHAHGVLTDFCSWKPIGWPKLLEPLYFNIQRYPHYGTFRSKDDLETSRIGDGILGDGLKPYIREYFRKVIEELRAIMGEEFELEVCNEFAWWDWPAEFGLAWHRWAVETLIGLGVPRERIVVSPPEGYERALAGQAGIVSLHGHSTARDIRAEYHGLLNERVELSGDGGYRGSGAADYTGRRCASADEAAAIARAMVERGYPSWEYFDFGLEGPPCRTDDSWAGVVANLDLFDVAPLRAFAEAARV